MELASPGDWMKNYIMTRLSVVQLIDIGYQLETDTRIYDVEYLDGTIENIASNVIAENLLFHVNEEGHQKFMIDEIIDDRSNSEALLH